MPEPLRRLVSRWNIELLNANKRPAAIDQAAAIQLFEEWFKLGQELNVQV